MTRLNRLQLAETFRTHDAWEITDDGTIDIVRLSVALPVDTKETITPYTQADYTTTSDGSYEYLTPLQVQREPLPVVEPLPPVETHEITMDECTITDVEEHKHDCDELQATLLADAPNADRIVCTSKATITLSDCEQGLYDAVNRIGAGKRKQRIARGDSRRPRQTSRLSMVGGLWAEEVLGNAWIIAHDYPELATEAVITRAIKATIKQGRQVASGEIPITGTHPITGKPITLLCATGYEQDTSDRLLELAYTVTSELNKTYREVDGKTVALGELLKHGYNQVQCAKQLDCTQPNIAQRIAKARKAYRELFADV